MELQWPLILFTTFVAWSAGLFGAQGAAALIIKIPDFHFPLPFHRKRATLAALAKIAQTVGLSTLCSPVVLHKIPSVP